MIAWIQSLVPIFKALHIAGLSIWVGGLLTLPLILSRHQPAVVAHEYKLMRRAVHLIYTGTTGAAVITVIAGTWLIFMQGVFMPWLYAKLAFVALLVAAHGWIGHVLVKIAEEPGVSKSPRSIPMLVAVGLPALAILLLVLSKPPLPWAVIPDWLHEPRGGHLPFEVPRR
ncbi:MAG: CopD family protein [Paracoccaceae bacterium]|nr:CopD family protein [Loktanella sp.]